jgi:hypothetical protein
MSTWLVKLVRNDSSGTWSSDAPYKWDPACDSVTFQNMSQTYHCRVVFQLTAAFDVSMIFIPKGESCTLAFHHPKFPTWYWIYDFEERIQPIPPPIPPG